MNRKQFILSQGAECANWTWSWSFVNHAEKFVIFGIFNFNEKSSMGLILSNDWEISQKGKKLPGFIQGIEHIKLVRKKGYRLFTFPMCGSEVSDGPAKISKFEPELTEKKLVISGGDYYAANFDYASEIDDEISDTDTYPEGAVQSILVNQYERNPKARQACLDHFGYKCVICEFDFAERYGEIGKNYIHVHHKNPMNEVVDEYQVDPIKDLIPVCPNCHAIIHRTRPQQTIEKMRILLRK